MARVEPGDTVTQSGVLVPTASFLALEAELALVPLLRQRAAVQDSSILAWRALAAAERAARAEAVRVADEALKLGSPNVLEQVFDTGTLVAMVVILGVVVIGQSY